MNITFVVFFLVYILVMFGIALVVSGKANKANNNAEQFLLGGRKLPFLLTLGTTVATMVGTGSSMGAVGFAYQNGWAGTLYGIGGAVGILLLAWWFAPLRNLRFMTMSEELSYYVGANTLIKNLIAVIIFVASIGWLGAHIIGGGLYLAWLTGMDLQLAKVLIAFSFALYVVKGGYMAVVWTDSIQAIILFCGFFLMAYFSIQAVGGWDAMLSAQPVANQSWFAVDKIGLLPAISLALAILVGILATPSFRQRIYSGKDVATIRRSFIYSGLLYLGFSIIPAIIGMSAFAVEQHLDNASFAFPHMALYFMPLGLGAFIIIAGISATLSSASSDAIAGVSVVMRDLYQMCSGSMPAPEKAVFWSRISLVLTISLALGFAMISNDIVAYITKMIAILMSGMCVCALLGRFWPRYNWQGALATLIAGSSTAIIVNFQPQWLILFGNPVIPSLCAALCCGVIVTLLTPVSTVTPEQALTKLNKQRAELESDPDNLESNNNRQTLDKQGSL
ncbi:sodium:solute symporter family protein [Paraglaciecola hydrolytica]|uniref:Sodium:proline symporter n=1 Tax=Paraglaciecola hydrolytica TaxID=1799789 RepID=A0A136A4D8_9ALTE|nr:sodium:solute symporter family protein [Paraglaciecola hydrolytica]KXI30079.1 sodium:proline symporter [Paraglaciecola hydrolytica]